MAGRRVSALLGFAVDCPAEGSSIFLPRCAGEVGGLSVTSHQDDPRYAHRKIPDGRATGILVALRVGALMMGRVKKYNQSWKALIQVLLR